MVVEVVGAEEVVATINKRGVATEEVGVVKTAHNINNEELRTNRKGKKKMHFKHYGLIKDIKEHTRN